MTIDGLKANVALAAQAVKDIVSIAAKGNLTTEKVTDVLRMVADETPDTCGVMSDSIQVAGRIKKVYAKSANQKAYVNAMRKDDMVFGIGPAGTGKTYLAMAMAVHYFLRKKMQ